MVAEWKMQELPKAEVIVRTGEAEIGWPYVWGAVGALCTPTNRRYYAGRDVCPKDEAKVTLSKCQVCRPDNPMRDCMGCKYFPDEQETLADDCQGFVKNLCERVGIKLNGGGCTSMWNDNSNWTSKGSIDTLPERVCCVFWTDNDDKNKKSHIGFYIGNGWMIHCSGEVKKEKLSKKCTDWAVPKGIDGTVISKPTIRRGDQGTYVIECQQDLIQLGYDVGATGADGKFGRKTEAAVKAFQANNGLKVDGIVGQATWGALIAAVGPQPGPVTTLYTVHIPHLTEYQADALIATYAGAWKTAEGE